MITTTIQDLITEVSGNRTNLKFQIIATPSQFSRLKEDLYQEWIKSGLVMTSPELSMRQFSAISFEGNIITFVEGDHFSIKEIDIDYNPPKTGTIIYSTISTK